MRAYIVEYRHFDQQTNSWISKISQEGYTTLEAAQDYIETRPGHMVQVSAMYYQTEGMGEYYIHDVMIAEQREAELLPSGRP